MFLLISSSSDVGSGKVWGVGNTFDSWFLFFFYWKLKSISLMHFCQRWVKHEPGEKKTNMPSKPVPALLLQWIAPFPHLSLLQWFFFASRFLFKTSVYQSQLSFGAETFTCSIVHQVLSVELKQCFERLENFLKIYEMLCVWNSA